MEAIKVNGDKITMREQRGFFVGHIYSIFTWDACNFASASQDGTTRIWDIRQPDCINVIAARPSSENKRKLFFFLIEYLNLK
jgi:WD40 repeat protein